MRADMPYVLPSFRLFRTRTLLPPGWVESRRVFRQDYSTIRVNHRLALRESAVVTPYSTLCGLAFKLEVVLEIFHRRLTHPPFMTIDRLDDVRANSDGVHGSIKIWDREGCSEEHIIQCFEIWSRG